MTRKQKKKSNNSDLKTTFIIVVVFIFLAFAFFYFLKKNAVVSKPLPKPPIQQTIPKKTIKSPKAVIPKPTVVGEVKNVKIAFVIDDWGYSTRNCGILKEIKQPLAIAILPELKHTDDVLACAKASNKTIMLHLPMQPYFNHDPYPTNYLLTTTMSPNKVESLLEDILKRMPQIEGVNNHMGSKAMESKRLLKVVFAHLKKHNLFFIDSMTSPKHSFGAEVAQEYALPFGQRDVFLDNVNTREAILKQFDELTVKAQKKGYAIAIGHDRELTMRLIKEQAPILEKKGFIIVNVKELLRQK